MSIIIHIGIYALFRADAKSPIPWKILDISRVRFVHLPRKAGHSRVKLYCVIPRTCDNAASGRIGLARRVKKSKINGLHPLTTICPGQTCTKIHIGLRIDIFYFYVFDFFHEIFRLSSRMIFAVHIFQVLPGNVGVDLSGGNIHMPQHDLNGTQVSAAFQKMAGKRVS